MFGKRFSRALAVTTVASLVMATAAFADNAVADGDGATPVANNDLALGAVGCNVLATDTALIAISRNGSPTGTNTFANGAVVTVSVLSVAGTGLSATIPTAGDANKITLPSNWTASANNTMSVGTVTANVSLTSSTEGADTGEITFRATGLNTAGQTINRDDPMTVSWTTGTCAPPNTAPTVSVSGVVDAATYEFGSVPVAMCDVTDTEDGNSSFPATLGAITGTLSAYELGSQTASCSYTDDGGLTDTDSATYTIADTGAPSITDLGPTTAPNGANGWYTTAVTNEFEASDTGAGFLSPLTNPYTFSQDSGTSEGSAVTIASGPVSDVAGNTAASINSAAFEIDLSNPYNVAFVGGPAAGSSHFFGSVPAAPTCTADDDVSGLASCVVTGYSSAVGSHTMTATATDNAGRTATLTRSYTVLAWTLSGFYAPVDVNALNIVKAGSTVPLKFEIFAGSTEFTTIDKIASFKVGKVPCGALDTTLTDDIEQYSTGQTVLRYDSTGGQFIQNWQVPKSSASAPAGSCYQVTMTTLDGSSLTAYFKTK